MKISALISKTLLATIVFLASACTHNDGDIGNLFGTWRVDSFTIDGVAQENDQISNTTFSFQNNIVAITLVKDAYLTYNTRYGTWSESDGYFTLNFTNTSDLHTSPVGNGVYGAPEWLDMVSDEPMVMQKYDTAKNAFTLVWHSPDGKILEYKLHKTW